MEQGIVKEQKLLDMGGRVPVSQKLSLGFANAGANMLGAVVGSAVLVYYLDVLHLKPAYIGTVYLLYGIWNALNDPLFGYWSDRRPAVPGKGKRLFFLKLGLPIYLIGFVLFWIPSPAWSQAALFANLFLALFIYDTALTMYLLNHNAIQAGMTSSSTERASISLWCTMIAVVPVAAVRFLPNYLLTGTIPRSVIIGCFMAVAAVAAVMMYMSVYRIKENTSFYANEKPLGLIASLKASLSSRSFMFFVVYSFAMGGVALASGGMSLLYLKYVFKLEGMSALWPVLIAGGAQILLYPVLFLISKRIGIRPTLLLFTGVTILGCAGMYWVTNLPLMIFFYTCCQVGAACHWLLLNAIVGDIADEDELKTGQRREGAFFGINALIVAPAQSIIFAFFMKIIERFGYSAAFGANPDASRIPDALMGLRLGAALVPGLFLVVGLIFLYFYPLKGEKYREVKKAVETLHEHKRLGEANAYD